MLRSAALILSAFAVVLSSACKSDEEKRAEESAKTLKEAGERMEAAAKSGETPSMDDAMAALGAAMGAANAGKKVEPVDFRELKEMLPESLPGMKRTEATGQRNAAMGMQISTANATYSNDQGANATLTITDIGSMSGLAGMAAYAWASTEIDRESQDGYEKTTRYEGHKALEKYSKSSRSGEVSVLVGDRFVVAAQGNGIEMDGLKDAVSRVSLAKLNGMKGQGVK